MDKFYIGYDGRGRAEVFSADDPKEATPEVSGYESVDGPFDTLEEANEAAEGR